MIITSVGARDGVPQAANNTTNKTDASAFILQLDSCAWAYACKLSLVFPPARGKASPHQTELDDDVALLAVEQSVSVS